MARSAMEKSGALRGRLMELDALRGIGALLVVNFHYSTRFHEMFPTAPHVDFTVFGGNYRVLLFFAISGFAIFFSVRRLASAWDFIAGRAARLFPAYWAAMMVTLLVEHIGHVTSLYVPISAVLMNVTMLQGFFYLPSVDGAYWTLTLEIAFYFCIIVLWMIDRLQHVELAVFGWLLVRFLAFHFWPDIPSRVETVMNLAYVPYFAIGMVSYRVWSGERRWLQQLPVLAMIMLNLLMLDTPDMVLAGLIIAVIFWATVDGYLGWLCVRPLLWVGSISYSLYLVHENVGFTVMLNSSAAGLPPVIGYALAVVVALILGALVNHYVERPGAKWVLAVLNNCKRWFDALPMRQKAR